MPLGIVVIFLVDIFKGGYCETVFEFATACFG